MLIALAVFAALSLLAAVFSRGFLEADACTHYVYARFALHEHHYLTDVWGRPFCTAIYAMPAAMGGRLGVRVMSLALALATAVVTSRIARGQGYRRPVLALIFLLAQPILFLHSFSELTELPFAFLLALAFWAYQKRQWWALALLAGLMPTARPEGFGFVIMAAAALLLHRRWWWWSVLLAPLALWSFAGWVQSDMPQPWPTKILLWLPDHWPYAAESMYERGWLTHFLFTLPAVVGPFAFPAIFLGVWSSLHMRSNEPSIGWLRLFGSDHRLRCQWLIAVIPWMILVGHSLLYWRGKMASNGELRYMLVVSPFWALLAAAGWEWAFDRCQWPGAVAWAGGAALAPIVFNVVYRVVPIALKDDWGGAAPGAPRPRPPPPPRDYPLVMASHPGIYYFLDISPSDNSRTAYRDKRTIASAPPGILLIWDSTYGLYNSDSEMSIGVKDLLKAGWKPIRTFTDKSNQPADVSLINRLAAKVEDNKAATWYAFVSPRKRDGRP
jgi:hypothetical protein